MESYKKWIARAKSCLDIAIHMPITENLFYEDLCGNAQQAVEKAFKGLLIFYGVQPDQTHDIGYLLSNIKVFTSIPEDIKKAKHLTIYAVKTKYPGVYTDVPKEEYEKAVIIATNCLEWVDKLINEAQGG